jgi:Glycosyltransferase family 87
MVNPLADSRRRWRWVVFAGALLLQGSSAAGRYSPNRWLYADGSFYYNIVRGFVEHGSLDQGQIHPRSWYNGQLGWNYNLTDDWSNVSVGRGGAWYPKHSFLMPLLSVPFFLAFGPVGTLIFNVLCGVLAALLAAELAALYCARWAAAALGLAIAGMPVLVRQAYGFNNDVFYSVLVVGGAILLLDRKGRRGDETWAGLLLGFSVLAKITNVIFLVPLGLFVLAKRDWRYLLRFALACSVGIGLAALANWVLFGAPWVTAYQRVLVVHDGRQEIQSHFRLFGRDFWPGLRALWSAPPLGLIDTFPAFALALVGCGVFAARKYWSEAVAFALCLILPLLLFAKYTFYRAEFLDPIFALAAAPLAACVGLLLPPEPSDQQGSRGIARGMLAVGGVLLVLALGRGALQLASGRQNTLVGQVERAQVFLGDVPCDYFNNQVERWECSGFDEGKEWLMTGRTLDHLPMFEGKERQMIDLDPHPRGQPRRMRFDLKLGQRLTLWYGLPDDVRSPSPVEFTAKLADQAVIQETVTGPGLRRQEIDTSSGAGTLQTLELSVSGAALADRLFYVDGAVSSAH